MQVSVNGYVREYIENDSKKSMLSLCSFETLNTNRFWRNYGNSCSSE